MELEQAKWENLPKDCLLKILGGVGIGSLCANHGTIHLLIPCVGRSLILMKSRDPTSFTRKSIYTIPGEREIIFFKSVVDRSCKSAIELVLPVNYLHYGDFLKYISNECPDLKLLSELIVKWRSLETLFVRSYSFVAEILTQVELHCKRFVGFLCHRCDIRHAVALSIINLSGLKYPEIKGCYIARDVLEMIIVNCKKLEQLDARDCQGFEGDNDLVKLASHINSFQYEGSIDGYIEEFGYYVDDIRDMA